MKTNVFVTDLCGIPYNIKYIFFCTLLRNQQLLCVILTKVKLILNKAFTFIILLLIPLFVNHSTPNHWEPANVSKTNLWTVNDLFTKWTNKTNALFLIENLHLCKSCLSFSVLFSSPEKHYSPLQKYIRGHCHGPFNLQNYCFTRVIRTTGIYAYSACPVINLETCCWFLNLV